MKICKEEGQFKVALEGIELEQVNRLRFTCSKGPIVNSEGSTKEEIRKRIVMAKIAYLLG